jgi:hypothetical protein
VTGSHSPQQPIEIIPKGGEDIVLGVHPALHTPGFVARAEEHDLDGGLGLTQAALYVLRHCRRVAQSAGSTRVAMGQRRKNPGGPMAIAPTCQSSTLAGPATIQRSGRS